MTDSPLSIDTPAPAATAPTAAPTVVSDLVLTPPAAVPVVTPTQASGLLPVAPERASELAERARSFVDSLAGMTAGSPEFTAKVAEVTAAGRDDISAAAAVSSRFLERPVAALAGAKGEGSTSDAQRTVANALLDLRVTVEELDPSRQEKGGLERFLLDLIPFKDKLKRYFAKYGSAQTQINQILLSLAGGKDTLQKDNAAIEGEKVRLWEIMKRLQEYAVLTASLDAAAVEKIDAVRPADPKLADSLTSDLLFEVRQKHQDLLTQLAVSAQGYLALDVVRKNNLELIKGVDRASTTTVSALRTAIIVAQALANQKLVLDQIDALNETTSNLIVATSQMLQQNSTQLAKQATSTTVSVEALQTAFTNIYATIDQIDTYKLEAVKTMGQTVDALKTQLDQASTYLERVKPEEKS